MKKLILIALLATGLSTLTYAKSDKTPEQKATEKTATLKKKLNLSADQSTKVHSILLTQGTSMDKLKKAKPKDEKQQHDALAKQTDEKLSAVFNPTQKKSYDAWKAEKKEKKAEKKAAKQKKA